MKYTYTTSGTCSRRIDLEIEDGIVKNVTFDGGCPGNTAGVALLARGCNAAELADRLSGVHCGAKATSCPDQLARAIREALALEGA